MGSLLLEQALDYRERGWSIVPLGCRSKRPTQRWERFQTTHAGVHELRYWFERNADRNVGIVTGAVSGLLVLDVDGDAGATSIDAKPIPATPTVQTGKGRHYYFAHPGGTIPNAVRIMPGVDVRADGGYVVAPPSIHESGRQYAWIACFSPSDLHLAPVPAWLAAKVTPAAAPTSAPRMGAREWERLMSAGAAEGGRNDATARVAGLFLRHLDPYVALEAVAAWNDARNKPPLSRAEVEKTVRSVASTALSRRPGARNGC